MRKLVLLALPLALLLATACNDENSDNPRPTSAATGVAIDDVSSTATADVNETAEPTEDESAGDASARAGELFGSFNPFNVLEGIGGAASLRDPDPDLAAILLTPGDLPADFTSLGEFAQGLPTEFGDVDSAASVFASGDQTTGQFGAMVMSAAMLLPPDAQAEMGDLDELSDLSQKEIDEISGSADAFGVGFSDVSVLDSSGLGDAAAGLHMEMDFAGFFEAFGAPEGDNPFAQGIAMDMYMFVRGDRMIMLMAMFPGGTPSGVDGHALAEIMDGRAS